MLPPYLHLLLSMHRTSKQNTKHYVSAPLQFVHSSRFLLACIRRIFAYVCGAIKTKATPVITRSPVIRHQSIAKIAAEEYRCFVPELTPC